MGWEYLLVFIVAMAISAALAPKPIPPKPAAIQDFEIPTAEEGRPIPVVFGTVLIKGPNVVWWGDLRSRAIRTSSGK